MVNLYLNKAIPMRWRLEIFSVGVI